MKKTLIRLFAAIILSGALFTGCSKDGFWPNDNNMDILGGYPNGTAEGENYAEIIENPFLAASENPLSTFSIDADGASFANMRRFVSSGMLPPKNSIRIEEFLNYFTFDYPEPEAGENVSLDAEVSDCPWSEGHKLLRLGIKGKTVADADLPYQNFVYLIDVSGSMSDEDKLDVLKAGFKAMTETMRPQDRVAIVTYAGEAGVLLEPTYGDKKSEINKAISKLGAGGSTAGAAGISTAYELAEKSFIPDGNNRVILGTDGDFNVGVSSTDELIKLIQSKRDKGIYLTVIGVGTGNLNDNMMEQVADNGNGNYEYVDNAAQMKKVFVNERSKFYAIAGDSKVQIKFDPDYVSKYRLIGYENRMLDSTDFQKDTVDAGEIGAGQTITALYEIIPTEKGKEGGEIGTFDFRYKLPKQSSARQLSISLKSEGAAVDIDKASDNQRFAASLAACGLLLRNSEYKGKADLEMVKKLGGSALKFDPDGYRESYIDLVGRMESLDWSRDR